MCSDQSNGNAGTDTVPPVSRFIGKYAHDFEIWSECYDSAPEISVLRDRLPFANTRLLDVGCGTGRLSFPLAPHTREVVGLDTHSSLIELCCDRRSNHNRSHLTFEVQDAANLPYPDDAFDIALDAWTFSSLDNPAPVAEEYGRVVADGGHIAVITGRNGSEFEEVLRQAGPQYSYDAAGIGASLQEYFGDPLTTVDIVAPHVYRSVNEADDAFDFYFEEYLDISLTTEQRDAVHKRIREHEWDSTVRLHEYARLYIFQNTAVELDNR